MYAAAVLFVASLVFFDVLGFVLAAGVQAWRVQWLLHWLAMASVPVALMCSVRDFGFFSVRNIILLNVVFFAVPAGNLFVSPVFALLLMVVYFFVSRFSAAMSGRFERFLLVFVCFLFVFLFVKNFIGAWLYVESKVGDRDYFRPEFVFLSIPYVMGFVCLAVFLFWKKFSESIFFRFAVLSCLFVCLLFSVGLWDRRTVWTKTLEGEFSESVFGVDIEPGAQVYWQYSVV